MLRDRGHSDTWMRNLIFRCERRAEMRKVCAILQRRQQPTRKCYLKLKYNRGFGESWVRNKLRSRASVLESEADVMVSWKAEPNHFLRNYGRTWKARSMVSDEARGG